ncbi:cell division protein FtsQ/DivIB [Oenococcus kitaharae]|nr:cell division protein FtsQ/DivIB [Oenococcus kitaharae]
MIHFQKGSPNMPHFKNPILNKIGLFFTALIFAILIAQMLLFLRPWQKITEVKVYTDQMDYKQILDRVGIHTGDPYWRWAGQGQTVNYPVKHDPMIKSVSMTLSKSGVASLHVQEILTAGFVQNGQSWYRLDQQGNLGRKIAQPDGRTPVYTNFSLESPVLKRTIKAYLSMDKVIRLSIAQIVFSPIKSARTRLALIMNDGNLVYARPVSMAAKMALYPQMVTAMKSQGIERGVIDLQYGSFARKFQESDKHLTDSMQNSK